MKKEMRYRYKDQVSGVEESKFDKPKGKETKDQFKLRKQRWKGILSISNGFGNHL